jgi:hypothetical protein
VQCSSSSEVGGRLCKCTQNAEADEGEWNLEKQNNIFRELIWYSAKKHTRGDCDLGPFSVVYTWDKTEQVLTV